MKILVLHTLPPSGCSDGRAVDELDLHAAAANVASALEHAIVAGVHGDASEILRVVKANEPDVVFNLCEAPGGKPANEAYPAALFEWQRIKFTGSSSETLALCRRKDRMNALLAARGVPVPRPGVFPAIVKPADEDGSAGIHVDSVCNDAAAVDRARARWHGPVLIQEFVAGREFAVSLWGLSTPEYVSIGETVFRNGLQLNTYASKWDIESDEFANSPLDYRSHVDPTLRQLIVAAARGAWSASGAFGYLRVDVRCNSDGVPCVLDVNPNPELGPDVGICRAVQEAGWTWQSFVRLQVEAAYAR